MAEGAGAQALTADLAARAIIAAARAYGDDPVKACLASRTSPARRALSAAACALQEARVATDAQLARAFGLTLSTLKTVRSKDRPGFAAARDAAARAVRSAAWRPDTGASAPPAAPADTVPQGPLRAKPGRLSVSCATIDFRAPAKVTADSSLRDRVLDAIGDGCACTQGLATLLDVKELLVSQTIRALEYEGRLVAGEMPPEGRRQQRWRRAG